MRTYYQVKCRDRFADLFSVDDGSDGSVYFFLNTSDYLSISDEKVVERRTSVHFSHSSHRYSFINNHYCTSEMSESIQFVCGTSAVKHGGFCLVLSEICEMFLTEQPRITMVKTDVVLGEYDPLDGQFYYYVFVGGPTSCFEMELDKEERLEKYEVVRGLFKFVIIFGILPQPPTLVGRFSQLQTSRPEELNDVEKEKMFARMEGMSSTNCIDLVTRETIHAQNYVLKTALNMQDAQSYFRTINLEVHRPNIERLLKELDNLIARSSVGITRTES